jgi:alpha/beta hydrolase fold
MFTNIMTTKRTEHPRSATLEGDLMDPIMMIRRKGPAAAVLADHDDDDVGGAVVVPPLPPKSPYCCFCSILRILFITLPIFLFIGLRLFLYVLVLLPFFGRFGYYYYFASHRRVVRYGHDSIRQSLDVFDPLPGGGTGGTGGGGGVVSTTPIVFFVCGGAWIIGYKMWGALLARVLTRTGVTVILPDYRNYPWGNVSESIDDVRMALEWTIRHNPGRPIVAVGQSAGSHLLISLFLQQLLLDGGNNNRKKDSSKRRKADTATTTTTTTTNNPHFMAAARTSDFDDDNDIDDAETEPPPPPSRLLDNVYGLIALSGPLDLEAMRITFRKFGLDNNLVDRIFGHNLAAYDPMMLLDRIEDAATTTTIDDDAVDISSSTGTARYTFPPLRLYHGTADATVPVHVAHVFCDKWQNNTSTLSKCLEQVQYYDGWSHTDPILEGPADGDHRFHRDVFEAVRSWVPTTTTTTTTEQQHQQQQQQLRWPDESDPILRPLAFHPLVQLARFFMPF